MLDIKYGNDRKVSLSGKWSASQTAQAQEVFDKLEDTTIVSFLNLTYISSAGLSVLLATQKRLKKQQQELILHDMNEHIREIFTYAGFDFAFRIE